MNRAQLEARVIRVADTVRRGSPVEDNAVELKRDWPDPEQVARQLCGLCNTARGVPAMLLIGVDESTHSVPGAPERELSNWYGTLEARFEGVAPRLLDHINVPIDNVVVGALLFETDRAPYVVRVSNDGRLEVAYRSATGTRSARREELVRMLMPQVRTPELELVGVSLSDQRSNATRGLELGLQLYVIPRDPKPLGIAVHRIDMQLRTRGRVLSSTFEGVSLRLLGRSPSSEVVVTTPESIHIEGKFRNVEHQRELSDLAVSVRIVAAGTTEAAALDIPLIRGDGSVWGASYASLRALNEAP